MVIFLTQIKTRSFEKVQKLSRIPQHIGVIPDGNRRFARKNNLNLHQAYEIGIKKVREFLSWCREFDIKYVTIYSLSHENLIGRSQLELNTIFNLMEKHLKSVPNDEDIHENEVRVIIAGDKSILPKRVIDAINIAEQSTENYNKYYLILLIGYSGRKEILDAIKKLISLNVNPEDITVETFKKYLYVPDIPDPDLVIRTSGEYRISNFLIWQIAYSELYFAKPLWPEFSREDFIEALVEYSKRERRYGR